MVEVLSYYIKPIRASTSPYSNNSDNGKDDDNEGTYYEVFTYLAILTFIVEEHCGDANGVPFRYPGNWLTTITRLPGERRPRLILSGLKALATTRTRTITTVRSSGT